MFAREFEHEVTGGLGDRIEGADYRPGVEIWPDEDGFAEWVAAHRDPVRTVICNTPEFASAPFCGRGYH
jgi:hypothetical protein